MMLAQSFKLLGLFLSLSIFASATPVDIVASSPAALERRVEDFVRRRCPHGSVWRRRECNVNMGVRAWRDVCDYLERPPRIVYPPGTCPLFHLCVPDVDGDGDETIRCVPMEKQQNSSDSGSDSSSSSDGGSPRRKKAKTGGAQSGTSPQVTAAPGPQNTQEEWESYINWDIRGASVSAEFVSTGGDFIVAPNNVIVGKIKGTNITVCEGVKSNPWKARSCYPKGRHDLKQGQVIAFTYGLTNAQSGYLHWAAIPYIHDELR